MRRAGLVRAGALVALLPMLMGSDVTRPEAPPPSFHVYHYASDLAGTAFREVFLVHDVSLDPAVPTTALELRRNGEPFTVLWDDADGVLSVEDRFSFVQEAFDEKQVLTAHYGGKQVMECRYGGGAGLPIHPDEWRQMGMPERVRCLELSDDQ